MNLHERPRVKKGLEKYVDRISGTGSINELHINSHKAFVN